MRAPALALAALLAAAGAVSPTLAAPLTDDAMPLETLMATSLSGAELSFGAGPDLPAVSPPAEFAPSPALSGDSLLLSEEGDDAEGGSAGRAAREEDLDEVLHIDAGVAPAPALDPVAAPGDVAAE